MQRGLTAIPRMIRRNGAEAQQSFRFSIKSTSSSRFRAPIASKIRNRVAQFHPVIPIQRPHALQIPRIQHRSVMRAIQNVHAHELHSIVSGEAARRRTVRQQMEDSERVAGAVELVAGVAGEIEAEVLVVVEDRRIDRAIEEREDGVRRGRDDDRLDVGHGEIVVRLEDRAGRHGRIVDHHGLLVVIDGLDFVSAGGSEEEEIGGTIEHAAELRRSAAVVDSEGVLDRNGAAGSPARRGERECECESGEDHRR